MTLPFRAQASPEVTQAHVDRVVPAYAASLNGQGCSPRTVSDLTRTARHMLAWLTLNEADAAALDIRGVDGFLSHKCVCPAGFRSELTEHSRWQANRVLGYLLETGQATVPSAIVTGGQLVEAFTGALTTQRYRESTLSLSRSSARHFIVWLYRSELVLAAVDGGVLERFLDHDCACAHPQFFDRPRVFRASRTVQATLARFASFLVDRGVVADWRDAQPHANGSAHVNALLSWLRQHRGLRDASLRNYGRALRALLPLLGDSPDTYDAASIRAAIVARAQSRSGLAGAVPASGRRPAVQLPRYVEESDIEALIASCDTTTSPGLRDRAILLLLARLALRSADITALRLGDIDWEQALLAVRGKSRRSAALPLPQEAGNALRDYILRARPRTASATVFPRCVAPPDSLSSATVSSIVRRAMKRAGIAGDGLPAAHLFRHNSESRIIPSTIRVAGKRSLVFNVLRLTGCLIARNNRAALSARISSRACAPRTSRWAWGSLGADRAWRARTRARRWARKQRLEPSDAVPTASFRRTWTNRDYSDFDPASTPQLPQIGPSTRNNPGLGISATAWRCGPCRAPYPAIAGRSAGTCSRCRSSSAMRMQPIPTGTLMRRLFALGRGRASGSANGLPTPHPEHHSAPSGALPAIS